MGASTPIGSVAPYGAGNKPLLPAASAGSRIAGPLAAFGMPDSTLLLGSGQESVIARSLLEHRIDAAERGDLRSLVVHQAVGPLVTSALFALKIKRLFGETFESRPQNGPTVLSHPAHVDRGPTTTTTNIANHNLPGKEEYPALFQTGPTVMAGGQPVKQTIGHTTESPIPSPQSIDDFAMFSEPIRGLTTNAQELLEKPGRANKAVLFWGPHRTRPEAGKADRRTMDGLHDLAKSGLGSPLNLTIILADDHGKFNGINNPGYLESVEALARERGIGTVRLSDLYERHGLSIDPQRLSGHRDEVERLVSANPELEQSLTRAAASRGGDINHGLDYAALRFQERPMIEDLLQGEGVLLVVGEPASASLFGEIPAAFVRAKAKSGAGWVEQAPWIQ